jgi:hypothetical protein
MVDYSTLSIVFTGLSISIASFYYISTLRNTRRNQELQLETRQAQLFTQYALNFNTVDNLRNYIEILNWEWEDYNDFETKYGSDIDTQAWAMRTSLWASFNYIGKLLKEDLISLDLTYNLLSDSAIWQWAKWKDIIEEQRKRYYSSDFMAEWEYLSAELMRHKEKLGFQWEPTSTFAKYIPDEQ